MIIDCILLEQSLLRLLPTQTAHISQVSEDTIIHLASVHRNLFCGSISDDVRTFIIIVVTHIIRG